MRCFWIKLDFTKLNPFPNYWYRAAFDLLMIIGGLSIAAVMVELGLAK